MKVNEIIEKAKKGFDEDFAKDNYMESRTGDSDHLNKIIDSLHIQSGSKVLDLGTGSGYLAFPIIQRYGFLVIEQKNILR